MTIVIRFASTTRDLARRPPPPRMSTFVVVTDSVHTSATLCDYLRDRLVDTDTVYGIAVVDPSAPADARRDAEDALNAHRVRLSALATVETALHDGPPAATLHSIASDVDADELVVGSPPPATKSADSGDGGVDVGGFDGETLARLLLGSPCPVVVVPLSG